MYFSPKTSADGLVFHYDTGNTVRSYLGEPTVNTVGQLNSFNPLDLYTWITGGYQMTISRDASVKSPVGGTVLKAVTSGTSAYGGSYNSSGYNIAAASVGQTWTMSIYIKAPVGSNPSIMLFEANSSGNYTALSQQFITPTGEWQRLSVTRTLNQATTAYVQGRFDMYTSGVTVYYDGLQFEQKSHPTQFVAGTRSATQGLKDLTGNRVIDLSNVSFDSNAQMTFDGTDDGAIVDTSLNLSSYSAITVEGVVKGVGIGEYDRWLSGTSGTTVHYPDLAISPSGQLNYYFASIDSSWRATGVFINTAKYSHLTYVFTTAGAVQVFVNGASVYTATHAGGSFPSVSRLMIGNRYDRNGEALVGEVLVTKIYSRALTADEVARNFNAIKSRFNIG